MSFHLCLQSLSAKSCSFHCIALSLPLGFLSFFWVLLFILLYLKRKQKFFHITVYFAYEQQYMSELIPSWEILWDQLVFDTYLGTNYPSLWISFFEAFSFVFRDVTSHRLQCRMLLVISCVFYFLCALNLFCDETQFKSHLFLKLPRPSQVEMAVLFSLVL